MWGDELLDALSQASQTCSTLVDQTNLAVRDAADDMAEAEDAYHIKLEAHTMRLTRPRTRRRRLRSSSLRMDQTR